MQAPNPKAESTRALATRNPHDQRSDEPGPVASLRAAIRAAVDRVKRLTRHRPIDDYGALLVLDAALDALDAVPAEAPSRDRAQAFLASAIETYDHATRCAELDNNEHPLGDRYEREGINVMYATLDALKARCATADAELLKAFADVMEGAGKPGQRFNRDIAVVVGIIERVRDLHREDPTHFARTKRGRVRSRSASLERAAFVIECSRMHTRLPLFRLDFDAAPNAENVCDEDSVDRYVRALEAEAQRIAPIIDKCIAEDGAATGAVAELIQTALRDGVVFGDGATLGRQHLGEEGRVRLQKLVDNARTRHKTHRERFAQRPGREGLWPDPGRVRVEKTDPDAE